MQMDVQDGCLYLGLRGAYRFQEFCNVLETALVRANREQLHGILLDSRQLEGTAPTITECYELGKWIAELQTNRRLRSRLAVLLRQSNSGFGNLMFIEVVALNRGATIKVFTERDAAIAWMHATH